MRPSELLPRFGIHRLQVRGEIALRFEPLLGQTPVLGAWEMRVAENRGP